MPVVEIAIPTATATGSLLKVVFPEYRVIQTPEILELQEQELMMTEHIKPVQRG